jgi:thermitase
LSLLVIFLGINAATAANPHQGSIDKSNQTSTIEQSSLASVSGNSQSAATTEPKYVANQIVVQFKPAYSSNEQLQSKVYQRISKQAGVTIKIVDQSKLVPGLELVEIKNCKNLAAIIKIFKKQPEIQSADYNYIKTIKQVPNDTYYAQLWGLNNTDVIGADINAQMAWNITTGSQTILVAVIDTGVDIYHPDLMANIYTNPNEIPNNGIDDDNNGFIDDVNGWNFFDNNNDVSDQNGHGTHVAGTIGAVGNNGLGVTGVAWNIKILPIKLAAKNWTDYMEIQAITYATNMGARVINCSYGGYGYSDAMKQAYENSSAIIICAAGNETNNNDIKPLYPASYNCPNIVSVAATNNKDLLAWFSNYGQRNVDLAAPGEDIYSTYPRALIHSGAVPYKYDSGTSMAAPIVSGVAALILSVNPSLTSVQTRQILLNSIDLKTSLIGKVFTGGRINAYKAVLNARNTLN